MAKDQTVTMISTRAFRIYLGKESDEEHRVRHEYPFFSVVAGENEVPLHLVSHPAMKANGVTKKE